MFKRYAVLWGVHYLVLVRSTTSRARAQENRRKANAVRRQDKTKIQDTRHRTQGTRQRRLTGNCLGCYLVPCAVGVLQHPLNVRIWYLISTSGGRTQRQKDKKYLSVFLANASFLFRTIADLYRRHNKMHNRTCRWTGCNPLCSQRGQMFQLFSRGGHPSHIITEYCVRSTVVALGFPSPDHCPCSNKVVAQVTYYSVLCPSLLCPRQRQCSLRVCRVTVRSLNGGCGHQVAGQEANSNIED